MKWSKECVNGWKQADVVFPAAELNNWLINAFNGEWLKISHPKPNDEKRRKPRNVPPREGHSAAVFKESV